MVYRELISSEDSLKFREAVYIASKEIDPTKVGYIGLVGTALQRDVPVHDLDVLAFPSAEADLGESYVEMNRFYMTVDNILQKDHRLFLAPAPRKILQQEVNHIIGQVMGKKGKLSTHTLFFPDVESYDRLNPTDFAKSVAENSETVVGNPAVVAKRRNTPQRQLEPYFVIADSQIPLIGDRYPEDLTLKKTEEVLDYLRKNYGVSASLPNNPIDCAKVMDELLVELDAVA